MSFSLTKTCKKIWSVHGIDASWNVQLCSTSQITSFADCFSSTYKYSALGVLNDYALCKSTHSLTHSQQPQSYNDAVRKYIQTNSCNVPKEKCLFMPWPWQTAGRSSLSLKTTMGNCPDVQICRQARVNLMFDAVDKKRSGKITYQQFVSGYVGTFTVTHIPQSQWLMACVTPDSYFASRKTLPLVRLAAWRSG